MSNGPEAFEKAEVRELAENFRYTQSLLRMKHPERILARVVPDSEPVPPVHSQRRVTKKIYFVRHGQGTHNVAQKEWKEIVDAETEPYTIDNDPAFKYGDSAFSTVVCAHCDPH